MKRFVLLILMLTLLLVSCTNNAQQNTEEVDTQIESEGISNEIIEIDRTEYLTGEIITDGDYEISSSGIGSICFVPDKELLLNGISLTKDIIRSVYRVYKGEENYTYELLLYILAVNGDENNPYKGYFPFDEDKGAFIFPLDKSKEVLMQVFGEKEYSFENVFNYDEESDIYYKNLDFGWVTGFRAENATAGISDDKSKIYTQFELINQWYDVEGDPVPTAIAECEITYSINKSNDKIYLQFENMEILSRLVE